MGIKYFYFIFKITGVVNALDCPSHIYHYKKSPRKLNWSNAGNLDCGDEIAIYFNEKLR